MGDYLLIPAMPTPNGRLHLGHIAGPYLRMDVLARHLRRAGHRVRLISGTDAYESHVLPRADLEGASPEDVCARYHCLIDRDLQALHIEFDEFIDPTAPRWRKPFARTHRALLRRLVRGGHTVTLRERFLYAPGPRRFVVGAWLSGRCPVCDGEVGGYCCEHCGYHFRPEEVTAPRATFSGTLEWREADCVHLRLPQVDRLATLDQPPALRDLVATYLRRQGGLFRLTIPGTWGIRADTGVVFTYGAAGYAVLVGDVYRALAGADRNAFDPGSDVTIICSCGIDNVVPFLVGIQGSLAAGGFRPYDHLLVNRFLSLEGTKFSTSLGHAVWVADLVERTPITSDALRYHLATISPDEAAADMSVTDLVRTIDEEVGAIHRLVASAASALVTTPHRGPASALVTGLRAALAAQAEALDPRHFDLRRAVSPLRTWTQAYALAGSGDGVYWWLRGFALIAWPFMPDLGAELWHGLGGMGEPAWATFASPVPGPVRCRPSPQPRLRQSHLRACLPRTLAGQA